MRKNQLLAGALNQRGSTATQAGLRAFFTASPSAQSTQDNSCTEAHPASMPSRQWQSSCTPDKQQPRSARTSAGLARCQSQRSRADSPHPETAAAANPRSTASAPPERWARPTGLQRHSVLIPFSSPSAAPLRRFAYKKANRRRIRLCRPVGTPRRKSVTARVDAHRGAVPPSGPAPTSKTPGPS